MPRVAFYTEQMTFDGFPGLDVSFITGGDTLKLRKGQSPVDGERDRLVPYLEINKEESLAIRLTIAKDFRREQHQGNKEHSGVVILLTFDGQTILQTTVRANDYGKRKLVQTVEWFWLVRDGVATTRVKPTLKQFTTVEENISKKEAERYCNVGTICVGLHDLTSQKTIIQPAAVKETQPQYWLGSRGSQGPATGTGDPDTEYAEQHREIARDPIPEKGVKGKDMSHGFVLQEAVPIKRVLVDHSDFKSTPSKSLPPVLARAPFLLEKPATIEPPARGLKRKRGPEIGYNARYYTKPFTTQTIHCRTRDELLRSEVITIEEQTEGMTVPQVLEYMKKAKQSGGKPEADGGVIVID